MRLTNIQKELALGNTEVIRFCKENNLDMAKIRQGYAEDLGNLIIFVLPREVEIRGNILEHDLATQPYMVLKAELQENGKCVVGRAKDTSMLVKK